ncbi:MAG: DsbA family protein [Massilia sp.]
MSLAIPVNENDHVQGLQDAPVTLVEYGDFQCPYCREAYAVVRNVQSTLGADLRFVFRHMPLTQVHPLAELAAEAAEAAGAQGKFWPMHDDLYENQDALSPNLLTALARRLGLDVRRFADDLQSHRYHDKVRQDFMGAVRSGAAGTPTFFINGERYEGGYDEDSLTEALRFAAGGAAMHTLSQGDQVRPRAS